MSDVRTAYGRGYTLPGANPYRAATAEHLAYALGKADRASGQPARPELADNFARLVALLDATRQGELLAEVEPAALDSNTKGSLI